MKRPLALTCVIAFLALAGALAGTGTVAGEEGGAAALAALWTAAGQVGLNVRPDVALTAAAFEVMAALKK